MMTSNRSLPSSRELSESTYLLADPDSQEVTVAEEALREDSLRRLKRQRYIVFGSLLLAIVSMVLLIAASTQTVGQSPLSFKRSGALSQSVMEGVKPNYFGLDQSVELGPTPSPVEEGPTPSPVEEGPTPSPVEEGPTPSPVEESPTPSPVEERNIQPAKLTLFGEFENEVFSFFEWFKFW